MMIERLESRRLFTVVSATLSSGGVLTIKGGSQANTIVVKEQDPATNPSNVHVELYEPGHGGYYAPFDFVGVTAINIGVSKYGETPDLAFQAARCLASPEHQAIAAELGGLPPTTESDSRIVDRIP